MVQQKLKKLTPKKVLMGAYSKAEEIANATSHGIGVALGITALVLMLLVSGGEGVRGASALVYGISIILLFLSSTLYHAIPNQTSRKVMKTLDHCAIYLLIAGTYTPYMLVTVGGSNGWLYFGIIWAIALVGVLFKTIFGHKYPKVSLASYLAMGWFVVVIGADVSHNLAVNGLILLGVGGLCYTVGAIFYAWKKLVFNHAIWHLFVLAGAVFHFFSIYWYVLPAPVVAN